MYDQYLNHIAQNFAFVLLLNDYILLVKAMKNKLKKVIQSTKE